MQKLPILREGIKTDLYIMDVAVSFVCLFMLKWLTSSPFWARRRYLE